MATVRALVAATPPRGIVFHHIPKCAGSSVGAAFRRYYPPWQVRGIPHWASVHTACFFADPSGDGNLEPISLNDPRWPAVHAHRLRLLHTFLCSGARTVSGHVLYHAGIQQSFRDTHAFVTILRDPVERFVSQYFYNRDNASTGQLPPDFGASELERIGPVWGSDMAYFLGGSAFLDTPHEDLDMQRVVKEAKKALEQMTVVGFVDRMEAFKQSIADNVGIQIGVGRRNVRSPRRGDEAEESWIRAAAERFCAPDLEIYAHARSLGASAI